MTPPTTPSSRPRPTRDASTAGAWVRQRNRSARDTLAQRLDDLLDDGTSRTRPELVALRELLLGIAVPDRALCWLRNNPRASDYLRGLATARIDLTHQALNDLPSPRTVAYLRDLLVKAGALPAQDRQIAIYQIWASSRLTQITDPDHAMLLRQFHTWHQLPRLHAAADRAPLSPGTRNYAAAAFNQATWLLDWITDRGTTLDQLTQTDLDAWVVAHPERCADRFLRWAMTTAHAPRLQTPNRPRTPPAAISQQRRLTWTRRILTDPDIELRARVAAGLVLLTAQPVVRIVALTLADVQQHHDDDGTTRVTVRLGNPPTPVPAPFSDLLLALARQRALMNTANGDSPWLFPGQSPGQHLTAGSLRQRLQALGLPTTAARTASLRQLAIQAPPPVVATALGYSPGTTENHRQAASGPWSRYTAAHQ